MRQGAKAALVATAWDRYAGDRLSEVKHNGMGTHLGGTACSCEERIHDWRPVPLIVIDARVDAEELHVALLFKDSGGGGGSGGG